MKEDGRNEEYPVNPVWRNPIRPHPSPNTVRQEDCHEDFPVDPAWGNPMPSTYSTPKENKGQSSPSSSWRPHVREDAASSAPQHGETQGKIDTSAET